MFHCWKERNEVETSPSIFPDPAGGYKYPETKNVSAILSRQPIRTTLPRCGHKKAELRQHFAPFPLFGRARSTSRYRMPPVLPSVGLEATLRTPDFRLRTIRPTFIFRPLRINSSRPENKKGCKRMFATHPTFRSFAEREGFEPPVQLPVHRISSAARSTTPASLPVHHPPFGR